MAGILGLLMVIGIMVSPLARASSPEPVENFVEKGSLSIHVPREGKDKESKKARKMIYFRLPETETDLKAAQKKYTDMTIAQIKAELGEGTETAESTVVGDDDVIEVRGIPDGNYIFKETEESFENHEYKISTIAWNAVTGEVTPYKGQIKAKVFKPEEKPLILKKIAYEGEEKKEITLAGVEFELYQVDKKDQAIKLIDKGNGIYEYGEAGDKSTLVTNKDGKIEIKNLPEGKYFFRETKTLEGYILNDKNRDSKEIIYNPAEGKDINITNNKEEKISVSLHKIDGDSKEKLKDVEFRLYIKSGNKSTPVGIKDGQYVAAENMDHTFKTDADGKIVVDNLPELAKGEKYVFREVRAPEGYVANTDQSYDALINKDITIKNYKNPKPIELAITKIDSARNTPLDRVGFELYRVREVENPDTKTLETKTERVAVKGDSGKYEFDPSSAQSSLLYQLHTDSEGKISVKGLPDGEYYFKENIVLKDYDLPENKGKESKRLTRDKNTDTIGNKPVTPPDANPPSSNIPKGGYRFVKIDDSPEQKRLAGAVFALYRVDGNGKVTPYEVDGKRVTIKSGENGEFEVRGLANGKYILRETVAPNGHLLDVKPIEFTASATSYANDAIMIVNKKTPRNQVPPSVTPPASTPPGSTTPPTTRQQVPPSVRPPGTTYYVPSNTPGIPRGPLVKTGDIRIVILAALGIIMIGGGVYLVRKSDKKQRLSLA